MIKFPPRSPGDQGRVPLHLVGTNIKQKASHGTIYGGALKPKGAKKKKKKGSQGPQLAKKNRTPQNNILVLV